MNVGIHVISVAKNNSTIEVVVIKASAKGRKTSETRHLWNNPAFNGYTDREGGVYREVGGKLVAAGNVLRAASVAK